MRSYSNPAKLHYFGANKSFRFCTYRPHILNPFRMRSYKKRGRGMGVADGGVGPDLFLNEMSAARVSYSDHST